MTRTEHLLCILAEECAELAHRATKALRFSLQEVEPGQTATNAERITAEAADLVAVFNMLRNERAVPAVNNGALKAKTEKVERYLRYSAECGTLPDECIEQDNRIL